MTFDSMRRLGHFTVAIEDWLVKTCPSLVVDDQVQNFEIHLQLKLAPRDETRHGHFGTVALTVSDLAVLTSNLRLALQKYIQSAEGSELLLGPTIGAQALARCFVKVFGCTTPKVSSAVTAAAVTAVC